MEILVNDIPRNFYRPGDYSPHTEYREEDFVKTSNTRGELEFFVTLQFVKAGWTYHEFTVQDVLIVDITPATVLKNLYDQMINCFKTFNDLLHKKTVLNEYFGIPIPRYTEIEPYLKEVVKKLK